MVDAAWIRIKPVLRKIRQGGRSDRGGPPPGLGLGRPSAWSMVVVLALGMGGCASQAPLPTTFPATTQARITSAGHWEIIANDIADQVSRRWRLDDPEERRLAVIPDGGGDSPFRRAFQDFLVTRLVNQGWVIAPQIEGSVPLRLTYHTQVVAHDQRLRHHPPGVVTALTGGLFVAHNIAQWSPTNQVMTAMGTALGMDMAGGYITLSTDHEVIITVSLQRRDRYLERYSNVYYLTEGEQRQYEKPVGRVIPIVAPPALEDRP